MKIAELSTELDILLVGPCSAGKNLESSKQGFAVLIRDATSRVNRKYGSWSIAHGIKHGTFFIDEKICGNELLIAGAAWMATKCDLPILSL
jgi:hypothetical protein